VRVLETHLEVGGGPTQELQGREFLSLVAASPYPVVAIGDFNTPPGGPTYQALTAVLHDAWTSARPADTGWTCCEAPSLADPARRELARVDLVLTSADWPVTLAQRTGDQPFRAAPPPLWASDHFGVTARVVVPGR
jgi:endonuclease/exonuclease/phosphatase family metal-dependent hydrolase